MKQNRVLHMQGKYLPLTYGPGFSFLIYHFCVVVEDEEISIFLNNIFF